jgi:hypothetical protein
MVATTTANASRSEPIVHVGAQTLCRSHRPSIPICLSHPSPRRGFNDRPLVEAISLGCTCGVRGLLSSSVVEVFGRSKIGLEPTIDAAAVVVVADYPMDEYGIVLRKLEYSRDAQVLAILGVRL